MAETPGTVYLVGAGPGDPELISLRGVWCLKRADVVLYDGLVNPLILRHTAAHCERTCREQGPDGLRLDQAEINRRLIDEARRGKCVVRLKGGDPFIFGRGSEEAVALRGAEIPFEIVPGITAAVAAAEYAGISLTHRDHASAVAFITGHEDPTKPERSLDYRALAAFPGTLVFYMGLHRLPGIVAALLREGVPGDRPACVISRGTWTLQRTVSAPLATLPVAVAAAELHAPSLIIVGECVALRDEIAWFERRPLFGRRIAIPRAESQFHETASLAIEYGAHPIPMPIIEIAPVDDRSALEDVLSRLSEFDWLIFTSANGVTHFFEAMFASGRDVRAVGRLKFACIGPATADALRQRHLIADLVPESFRAEELAASLASYVSGQRVLWARASRGRDVLPDALTAAGADLEQVVVYENRDREAISDENLRALRDGVDWIALSSPSIARGVAALLPADLKAQLGTRIGVAAISPVTAEAAREAGIPVTVVAEEFTWRGLFEAIARG